MSKTHAPVKVSADRNQPMDCQLTTSSIQVPTQNQAHDGPCGSYGSRADTHRQNLECHGNTLTFDNLFMSPLHPVTN